MKTRTLEDLAIAYIRSYNRSISGREYFRQLTGYEITQQGIRFYTPKNRVTPTYTEQQLTAYIINKRIDNMFTTEGI